MEELHGLLSLGKRYEFEQRRIVYSLRDESEADGSPNEDLFAELFDIVWGQWVCLVGQRDEPVVVDEAPQRQIHQVLDVGGQLRDQAVRFGPVHGVHGCFWPLTVFPRGGRTGLDADLAISFAAGRRAAGEAFPSDLICSHCCPQAQPAVLRGTFCDGFLPIPP